MRRLPLIAAAAVILASSVEAGAADYAQKSSWGETMTAMRIVYLQSPEAQAAAARDSLFKPFDSGPLDGKGPAKQVVVDIAGLKEMRLVAICVKGPANCSIWGEPKLVAKDGAITKLTDLKPAKVSVGWGQLLVDKNWQNHPLIVGDRQFEFGFWVHADSELTFALDGKYERFEAFVGEDKDRAAGLVRFKVLSAAVPLPTFWMELASDFPLQTGWLRADTGADGVAAWFGKRKTGSLEQEIIGRALQEAAPDSPLLADLKNLNGLAQLWEGEAPAEPRSGPAIGSAGASPSRQPGPIIPQSYLAGTRLAAFDAPLAELQQAVADTPVTDTDARRALHHEICRVRRQIAFANPLLDFQDHIFKVNVDGTDLQQITDGTWAYGSIIIINPKAPDDDGMGPVRRFTPEVGFPESQGGRPVYSTPWPLSENYHLCVYDAAMSGAPLKRPGEDYGIYLVDAFGNKELLYRDRTLNGQFGARLETDRNAGKRPSRRGTLQGRLPPSDAVARLLLDVLRRVRKAARRSPIARRSRPGNFGVRRTRR